MTKKINILFDVYHLYHLPQFEPVIQLALDRQHKVFLSYSSSIPDAEKVMLDHVLSKFSVTIITGSNEEERARKIKSIDLHVFICGWSRYPIADYVNEHTIVGMIYHGIGVKPSYWNDHSSRLNIRFLEGPLRKSQLIDRNIQSELPIVGFAKLDPLFQNHNNDSTKFNLDKDKKTILYAPTFYPSSLEKFGLSFGELSSEYNVLLKLHAWTYLFDKWGSGISLKKQLTLAQKLDKLFPHVHLLPPDFYNITPLYRSADILLSEASSTIYEMMALDKPVVLATFFQLKLSHRLFKSRLYKRRLDSEMSQQMTDFCFYLNRPKELPVILKNAFDRNSEFQERRDYYKKEMLYKLDGKVSERILNYLENRIQNHP